jgi:uncharacterized protein (TIGR03437 family)
MINRLTGILLLIAVSSVSAADFQNGQAARAVIGQSSFSAREPGILAHALTVAKGHLYAADSANHILAFDIAKIPAPKDDLSDRQGPACALCGFSPVSVANQSVMQGIAASAVFGRVVVIADTTNRRVLIWRGVNAAASGQRPDVVLSRTLAEPASVAFDGKRLFVGDLALHRVLVWNTLPAFDDQPADAVLGQPDFVSSSTGELGAGTLRSPAALASDGANLFVADAADRRILVFAPGDASLAGDAAVNSASLLATAFAPGTLVTLKGAALSDAPDSVQPADGEPPAFKLGGVEVFLNGVPLPLLSVSSDQLQTQLPYDLGNATAGSLYVRTEHSNGTVTVTNAIALRFTAAYPGIFAFGGSEPRSGLMLHTGAPITLESPAKSGEVVTVWAAGLGVLNNDSKTEISTPVSTSVNALVNGQPAEVVSAALPAGAVGVYEVRVILPAGLASKGPAQLLISQNGNASNTVTFAVDSENP